MRYWLSRFQAEAILRDFSASKRVCKVSLDLGRSESKVGFEGEDAVFPDGQRIPIGIIGKVADDPVCSLIDGSEALRLQFFRKETNRAYRLVATGAHTPPTAELAGYRMHRVKGTDPGADTASKIKPLLPLRGCRVLDTCTGLGYTAIAALDAGAQEVVTVEVDEGMVMLREANPWSSRLADGRIVRVIGDIRDELPGFGEGSFDAIVHDPPSMSIAGELYSAALHKGLFRVLKEGGMLFHYVGAPGSRHRGRNLAAGVAKRLADAGFVKVRQEPRALGLVASR